MLQWRKWFEIQQLQLLPIMLCQNTIVTDCVIHVHGTCIYESIIASCITLHEKWQDKFLFEFVTEVENVYSLIGGLYRYNFIKNTVEI